MSIETNKQVVRSFVAAWNDKEFGRFEELMADDAVLTVGGNTRPAEPFA